MDREGDIEFIKMAQENPSCFDRLYEKYSKKVYRFIFFRVGYRRDVAEDLVQETFYRALRHIKAYRDEGSSYLTYLFRIAHNLLVNYYRYSHRHAAVPLDAIAEAIDEKSPDLEEQTQQKFRLDALWDTLQILDEVERKIVTLRFAEQLPIKDIAIAIGKTENAVKLAIMRIRRKLRNKSIFEVTN